MTALKMAGLTDPGMRRDNNEDAYLTVPEIGLAVLADGMGGHLAGEVASGIAVDVIRRNLIAAFAAGAAASEELSLEAESIKSAIELANQAINETSAARPECAGMGATVVAAVFHEDRICVAHVGDSRLYRLRAGQLEQVTEDHSMIQELLKRGFITPEEARVSTNKNVVTRALGVDVAVQVDVAEQPVNEGDVYLLCSDGLSDVLTTDSMQAILLAHGDDLDTALTELIAQANAGGGPDNVSAILVRTGARFARNKKIVKKLQDAVN